MTERYVAGVYNVTVTRGDVVRRYKLSHPSARRLEMCKQKYATYDGLVTWVFPARCELPKPVDVKKTLIELGFEQYL